MGLLDVIRAGVKVADQVTKDLQSTVTYKRYKETNSEGTRTFYASKTLRAIVDRKQTQVKTAEGIMSLSRASITFLDIDALMLATGNAGINTNDVIVLPDGTTGPILNTAGFMDRSKEVPVATEVYLG